MFKINLGSFQDQKEIDFELNRNDISFDKGIRIEEPVKVELVLTKEKSTQVIVEGKLNGVLGGECSRCLEAYKNPVSVSFVTIYKDKKEFTDDDKDSDVNAYENNEIDLYDFLRQTMILEMPMKPLCIEDCKGLCPVCGKNLNRETCGCKKEIKLNRFEELDKLEIRDQRSEAREKKK